MKRREFIARLLAGAGGVAIAATVDIDRLLWEVGARKIFLPAAKTWEVLMRGDVFTIAGQFALNPVTGLYTRHLQRFVVTADVTANDAVVPIWPTIIRGPSVRRDRVPVQVLGWDELKLSEIEPFRIES